MRNPPVGTTLKPMDVVLVCSAVAVIVATSVVRNVWDEAVWRDVVTAVVWTGVIVLFCALATVRRNLLTAGAWMIVLGAVLAVGVIPVNEFMYPFTEEGTGGIEAHDRFHFFVSGSYALAGILLMVVLALGPLRQGRAWAWWAIGGAVAIVLAGDIAAYVRLYPHLLHFLIVAAWVAGLAMAKARLEVQPLPARLHQSGEKPPGEAHLDSTRAGKSHGH